MSDGSQFVSSLRLLFSPDFQYVPLNKLFETHVFDIKGMSYRGRAERSQLARRKRTGSAPLQLWNFPTLCDPRRHFAPERGNELHGQGTYNLVNLCFQGSHNITMFGLQCC